MAYLADITLRRGIALFIIILSVLIGGTLLAIHLTTSYLVNEDARKSARNWAQFLAANVTDLKQIAAGELPSSASISFFNTVRNSDQVFRYVIYNRQGFSQFTANRQAISSVDLSELSSDAAEAASQQKTIIITSGGDGTNLPEYFAHAYVPIFVDGMVVGVVAAFVDETEQRTRYHKTFLIAAISLCILMALSFGIPATAWYFRTKEKQHSERRIRYLAHHDSLTGLTNRPRLIEQLQLMLASMPSDSKRMAVHFIDLDRFKEINDTLGHDAGDFLLKTIGERLRRNVRSEDLVARLGGDEFVAVQTGVEDKKEVSELAERLIEALRQPMHFGQQEIAITVTIGVAIVPDDGATPERVLKSADLALYAGKSAGRGCVCFFSPDLDEAMQKRLQIEKLIRDATEHDRFVLHYQPIYEMDTNRLIGYEALLRLPAKDGSLIAPGDFLFVAEEMRLIERIGEWVIKEACRTAADWPNDLTVAVNLSSSQFVSGKLIGIVENALKQSGLAPYRLELEITEVILLGDVESTMSQLRALKALGVSIAMDDFGTGYSSLSYLWKFPFDKVKIDRSFMEGFMKSGYNVQTVIKTIIALSRELNMRVTVEGVENSAQVDFISGTNVDEVQGFYFGHPIQASELGAHMINALRDAVPKGNDKPAELAAELRSGSKS